MPSCFQIVLVGADFREETSTDTNQLHGDRQTVRCWESLLKVYNFRWNRWLAISWPLNGIPPSWVGTTISCCHPRVIFSSLYRQWNIKEINNSGLCPIVKWPIVEKKRKEWDGVLLPWAPGKPGCLLPHLYCSTETAASLHQKESKKQNPGHREQTGWLPSGEGVE